MGDTQDTARRIATVVASVIGSFVVLSLFFVAQQRLIGCFTQDPTPAQCDRYGLTGKSDASRFGKLAREEVGVVADEPELLAYLKKRGAVTDADGERIGRELSAKGMKRLPAANLEEWNRLRIKLAEHSASLCAAFWTGGATNADLFHALLGIPESEARGFLRLSSRAMMAEVRHTSKIDDFDPNGLVDGLRAIADGMPGDRRSEFLRKVQQGVALRGADACSIFLTMSKASQELPGAERDRFLRSLAATLAEP